MWKTGIDITVENPVRDENGTLDFTLNMGEEVQYLPKGPKCNYNDKEVTCLTFESKSGGITGKILVQMLEHFDKINLFPREPGGPIPMLVLDGHQSSLDPMFVAYINTETHHSGSTLVYHMQQCMQ